MTEKRLIFRTVVGSHLYGFAHPGSDYDIYEVYEGKGRSLKQTMEGNLDIVRGDLEAFLLRAATGSHQSAEALFSNQKDWEPGMEEKWGPMLQNFRLGGEAFRKYERTIKKFCFGDFKKRRHACRLAINLHEMRVSGRGQFDPRLHPIDRSLCEGYAKIFKGDALCEQLQDMIHPPGGI